MMFYQQKYLGMHSQANKLFSRADSTVTVVGAGLMRTVLGCNARKLQNLKLDFIQIDQETEESTSVTPRRKIEKLNHDLSEKTKRLQGN